MVISECIYIYSMSTAIFRQRLNMEIVSDAFSSFHICGPWHTALKLVAVILHFLLRIWCFCLVLWVHWGTKIGMSCFSLQFET